jgi:hypothetical protein
MGQSIGSGNARVLARKNGEHADAGLIMNDPEYP